MKNGTKAGIFVMGLCAIVALLMAMPVSATTYYEKVTTFSDNFDTRTKVDWNAWETQIEEDDYSIDYNALNVSWEYVTRTAPATLNWSYGIYTQDDITNTTNTTIYSDNDIYLQQSVVFQAFEMWEGCIDDTNIGTDMPLDTSDGVGQVGVVFVNSFESGSGLDTQADGLYAWYVDTTDTLQFKELDLTVYDARWYHIEKIYNPEDKTATVNVTDTVSGESDEVDITHIRIPVGEIRQAFFGWVDYGIIGSPLPKGMPEAVTPLWQPVAFVDNVDIYGYELVTVTPVPTPAIEKDWAKDIGQWVGYIGAIVFVGGLIGWQDLAKYLNKKNYDNAGAIATVPMILGGIMMGVGVGYYYGYGGVVHKFWTWMIQTIGTW